jgi:Domain of unknown function (DUF4902)
MLSPKFSADGYIRLRPSDLCEIHVAHLFSALDQDAPLVTGEGAVQTEITGYTEWASKTKPAISIGWDWALQMHGGRPQCVRYGDPRSNLMLTDIYGYDLGTHSTSEALGQWVDSALDFSTGSPIWQTRVLGALRIGGGHPA